MFWSMRDHVYKVTLQDYNGPEKLNTDFTATQTAVCHVYSCICDVSDMTVTDVLLYYYYCYFGFVCLFEEYVTIQSGMPEIHYIVSKS